MLASERSSPPNQIGRLRSAIDKQDAEGIKSGTETLEKLMHEIAQAAYSQAGQQPGGPGAAPGPDAGPAPKGGKAEGKKAQDDVIDAEYEEGN